MLVKFNSIKRISFTDRLSVWYNLVFIDNQSINIYLDIHCSNLFTGDFFGGSRYIAAQITNQLNIQISNKSCKTKCKVNNNLNSQYLNIDSVV